MAATRKPLKPGPLGVALGYNDAAPRSAAAARKWIQEAVSTGCYTPSVHLRVRLTERGLTMADLFHAIRRPSAVEPYAGMPQQGGTCWRVIGHDLEQEQKIAIGVEAYRDERGRWAILCTIFAV